MRTSKQSISPALWRNLWRISIVLVAMVTISFHAQAAEDYLDACGTWYKRGSGAYVITPQENPYVKGMYHYIFWNAIETADDVWDWDYVDDFLEEATGYGYYIGLAVWTGTRAPEWLYDEGVPCITTEGHNLTGPWPYYLNETYQTYFERMISRVYSHIDGLDSSIRNRIIFFSPCFGSTQDPCSYKGTIVSATVNGDPVGDPSIYNISDEDWIDFCCDMSDVYYYYYGSSDPRIFLQHNDGSYDDMLPGFTEYLIENCPGRFCKTQNQNKMYACNNEVDRYNFEVPKIHSKEIGCIIRARCEQADSDQGWWLDAVPWNQWTLAAYGLYCGLDFPLDGSDQLRDAYTTHTVIGKAFELRNRYGGRKFAQISPGGFCSLKDTLDASDIIRFPEGTYGTALQSNTTRYENIAGAYEAYGAAVDDVTAAIGSHMVNRGATGLNDVGWNLLTDNYCRYIYQHDPNGTSIGWWRVGSTDEIYGRFARGFQHSTSRDTMYFDIDDILLGDQPVDGDYPVTIKVVYYDDGTGTWELKYDSTTGDKRAVLVTKTDSETWKEQVCEINDAYFGNRCSNGTDFYLNNTDTEDDIFSFIEVLKPCKETCNVDPWFLDDPVVKQGAVQGENYWDYAYQQLDLDIFDVNATETLTVTKVSGPSWLSITSDGDLKGTPTSGDVGLNEFEVQVSDTAESATADLNIPVYNSIPPAAPTGLGIADVHDDFVKLDWDDNTEANLSGYNVYRSTTSGRGYSKINGSLVTASAYTDSTVSTGTTYYYTVTALDNYATYPAESLRSEECSIVPDVYQGELTIYPDDDTYVMEDTPDTDRGANAALMIRGSGSSSERRVFLKFTVTGVVGPILSAKLDLYSEDVNMNVTANEVADNTWLEETLTWNNMPSMGSSIATQYAGTSVWVEWDVVDYVTGNGVYSFAMTGANDNATRNFLSKEGGASSVWPRLIVEYQSGDTTPPAGPTSLDATAGNGIVSLDWDDNTESDFDGYNVYRSTTTGSGYSMINGSLVSASAYTDSTVSNDTTYYYVVTAVDLSTNESGYSSEDSATPSSSLWNVLTYDDFESGWGNYTDGGEDCLLYTGGTYAHQGTAAADIQNGTAESCFYHTNGIDVDSAGYNQIKVEFWFYGLSMDNDDDFLVDYYDGSSWQTVATYVQPDDFSNGSFYDKTGENAVYINEGTGEEEYTFPSNMKIRFMCSANGDNDDVYIDEIKVSAVVVSEDTTPPANPTGLDATAGNETVSLDWNDNTEGDLDGYNVYRSTTTGSGYSKINGSVLSASAYTDNTVSNNTTYYYVVTAVDTDTNESGYSNEDSAYPEDTTSPANPTGLDATAGDEQVSLDWNDNTEGDFDGYNVYRSTTTGSGYSKINGSLVSPSDYTDSTVSNGTTYYYVVTAVDTSSNESGYSNEDWALPQSNDIYVYDITMGGYETKTDYYCATATVWIKDVGLNDINGATVYGSWSGATTKGDDEMDTGSNGKATLTSDDVKGGGTFTFTVTDVTATGYTYNSSLNNEDYDSITVP